jgi:hypothetical protein
MMNAFTRNDCVPAGMQKDLRPLDCVSQERNTPRRHCSAYQITDLFPEGGCMKKIALAFAAAAAICMAVPASAQTVIIRDGAHRHHHHHGWRHHDHRRWRPVRVEPRRHYGYRHHHHHRGPAVVIRP